MVVPLWVWKFSGKIEIFVVFLEMLMILKISRFWKIIISKDGGRGILVEIAMYPISGSGGF